MNDLEKIFGAIPDGAILGLNFSGNHDSAIAVVSPSGEPILGISLERLSRIKQDGRPPSALIEGIPWDRIRGVAVSTESTFELPSKAESLVLDVRLPVPRIEGLKHGQGFYDFINSIPCQKEFVCHQLAHASSAYWGSGFDEALCLTYDGGMFNSPWFGGVYGASRQEGIRSLDRFNALHYAKVTSLYSFVTALLGFTPSKHEGKITGLAAYGQPTNACRALITKWFEVEYAEIESTMEWVFAYDSVHSPILLTNEAKIQPFRDVAHAFTREEIAATVQEFAELHVVEILAKASKQGWTSDNICLAGGLFANVKINQRVAESGFKKLFVAPPMTDEGTALGAAWHVLSGHRGFNPQALHSVYWGPTHSGSSNAQLLRQEGIQFRSPVDPAKEVAQLLATGAVVAVCQGAMEFGPRALGNRSILAQATQSDINQSLNDRLNRTEFMPFAPVSRAEDADRCYLDTSRVGHCAEFMTVTVNCTEDMKKSCPAVVHVDGTARPQLVSQESNPFIHAVLSHYIAVTDRPALVNTSFNIHEEPIVCSTHDALQGFFESGIDYLYLEGGHLISFKENVGLAVKYLQKRIRRPSHRTQAFAELVRINSRLLVDLENQLSDKEEFIQRQAANLALFNDDAIEQKSAVPPLLVQLGDKDVRIQQLVAKLAEAEVAQNEKEEVIHALAGSLRAYRLAFTVVKPLGTLLSPFAVIVRHGRAMLRPRLGNLNQHPPFKVTHSQNHQNVAALSATPTISIVTPSFKQGAFIEQTLLSVVDQQYPNLEYFVQDGASTDETVDVLKRYEGRITAWESQPDEGQSHAINLGFARTSGEIMAWLNSDDLLLPGALATVVDYFNRHPEVDVVYGNRLLIDENGMQIGRWIMPGHDSAVLSWVDYVPQETLFWRRSIWDKTGGKIDESFKFAMDWDLLVRFRDAGATFAHIPRFLGAFRIHAHQKTSAAINEIGNKEMNRIRLRLLGMVPTQTEIGKAILPFMLKHIAADKRYALKTRLGFER
jgi:predicted NodU family carbamoyl transferase/GT2 family glycosyltransferase